MADVQDAQIEEFREIQEKGFTNKLEPAYKDAAEVNADKIAIADSGENETLGTQSAPENRLSARSKETDSVQKNRHSVKSAECHQADTQSAPRLSQQRTKGLSFG